MKQPKSKLKEQLNLKTKLNQLAWKLYLHMGYRQKEDFDFSASSHPTERMCYCMAETAYEFLVSDRPSANLEKDAE